MAARVSEFVQDDDSALLSARTTSASSRGRNVHWGTREETMTAREFEDQLVKKGLPQEAIRTLTRLFEQVRYGSAPPNPRDEVLALECLTDIAKACGSSWSLQPQELA